MGNHMERESTNRRKKVVPARGIMDKCMAMASAFTKMVLFM
jgi:hypothetical protein